MLNNSDINNSVNAFDIEQFSIYRILSFLLLIDVYC